LIDTDFGWVTIPLDASYLASSGLYFIRVGRSGEGDAVNGYSVTLDSRAGYAAGDIYFLEDDQWLNYNYDMPFQVYADVPVETTQQVASLARNYGQFFRQVLMSAHSGIAVESYRDGDSTALFEIAQLLQMGTENYRRLLAEVDVTRRLRIYEEPAIPAAPYLIFSDGVIAEPNGLPLRSCTCPVGMWARWTDVVPPSVNTTRLADPALVFIDENEYEAASDRLTFLPRGMLDPFDYAKVSDG
jgi:hypothetical protein